MRATVPDGAGGYYVGGAFTEVGGTTRNNIAHILADGSVDTAFNPNANGNVETLAVSGSPVYAGGSFTVIGGQTRHCIAALNASSGAATAWNPNATKETGYVSVSALAVSGSTVYAGGLFSSIGGQNRNNIAALDASSGLATAWDPDAGGDYPYDYVQALAVSGSTIYVGGPFTSIGGQNRGYLARFSPPAPPTVISPNGSENWMIGSSHNITWNTGNGGRATIELSRDNGSSWETLFASTVNDGSAPWTVSGPTTSQALVRISSARGSGSSTATFAIAPALTGSLSLNGGATYTTSTAVTISSSVANVNEMRFRNAGDSWGSWEPYAASKAWTLPAGDGAKTVEAQYRDADGNVLDLSAGITLDTTKPTISDNAPAGWNAAAVTVTLTAADSGSGVAKTQYRLAGSSAWLDATANQFVVAAPADHSNDGTHNYEYRALDNAGTASDTGACTVKIDTVIPAPTLTPKITLQLSGLKSGAIKLGKSVTAKGTVTPTSLKGSKVTLTVQQKKGSKWTKVKSASSTIGATGAYSWKYKPAKKGAYRIQAAIAKTATHTAATTKWLAFKAK